MGTTLRALPLVPKMPRLTSWPATSAGSSAASTQSSQVTAGWPRRAPGLGQVLPGADHGHLDPVVAGQLGQCAPIVGAPCSGVNTPTKTSRSRSPVEGRARPAANQAEPAPTGTTTARRGRRSGRASVLRGVHHDEVGPAAARRRRSPASPALAAGPLVVDQTTVAGRADRRDEMVEHDGRTGKQPTGQPDIEVAQIPDQYRVGPPRPPAAGPRPHPASPPSCQWRAATPGRRHGCRHCHPGRGVDPQRFVQLGDRVPAGAQSVDEDRDPGVAALVVRTEDHPAHRHRVVHVGRDGISHCLRTIRPDIGVAECQPNLIRSSSAPQPFVPCEGCPWLRGY